MNKELKKPVDTTKVSNDSDIKVTKKVKKSDNFGVAHIKLERISPRKARLVADLIRYKDLSNAINILKNTNKKAAPIFLKLLNSAVANAVNNQGMNADKLSVSKVIVNEGPTLKRFQPRGRGRAFSILKRTSKMTIEVSEKGSEKGSERS